MSAPCKFRPKDRVTPLSGKYKGIEGEVIGFDYSTYRYLIRFRVNGKGVYCRYQVRQLGRVE